VLSDDVRAMPHLEFGIGAIFPGLHAHIALLEEPAPEPFICRLRDLLKDNEARARLEDDLHQVESALAIVDDSIGLEVFARLCVAIAKG
jgi:hypothetical protein